MYYKNISNSVKTFYGVEFKPGQVNSVPGFINDKYMIVTDLPKEPTKQKVSTTDSPKSAKKADAALQADAEEVTNNIIETNN